MPPNFRSLGLAWAGIRWEKSRASREAHQDPHALAHILVVEDDEDSRASLTELLEAHGFDVIEAPDGKRALDHMVSVGAPALVILDLEMPIMSGGELLDVMRRYFRLSRIPVLIVSGASSTEVPPHTGVIGFLGKPCNVETLLDKVRTHAAHA
jgi:DNA-binding response OmpR family regulator